MDSWQKDQLPPDIKDFLDNQGKEGIEKKKSKNITGKKSTTLQVFQELVEEIKRKTKYIDQGILFL